MLARLFSDWVRLVRWGEDTHVGTEISLRGDYASALAFARRLSSTTGAMREIRVLLAREHGQRQRFLDGDVLAQLAVLLASGRIVALRIARPVGAGQSGSGAEDDADAFSPESNGARIPEPKTWIEIYLVDLEEKPVPHERYVIELPDGSVREGRLDAKGRARADEIDPGKCQVTFPDLDKEAVAKPGEPPHLKTRVAKPPPLERKTWIEIELVGMDGSPIPNEHYRIELATGEVVEGRLDDDGRARVDGIDRGSCVVGFPELDKDAWGPTNEAKAGAVP